MGCFILNKNIMTIILTATFMLILCSAGNILVKEELDPKTLEQYENINTVYDNNLKTKIIENIFNNIGRAERTPIAETTALTVIYGDVVGDKQDDAIFIVKTSPKNTIVATYEKINDTYKYSALVDDFFDIKAIQVVPVENQKNIILIREHADQMLGSYEDSVFLRAYKWDNSKFKLILNVLENYKAYWNELWDNNKPKEETHWLVIKQDVKVNWKNNKYNTLYVKQKQMYEKSNETNTVNMPFENDFQNIKQREVLQIYYWSTQWQHFILGEGKEIKTGKKVAILEDMSQSAFSLFQNSEKYRVKYSDETIGFIEKNNFTSN